MTRRRGIVLAWLFVLAAALAGGAPAEPWSIVHTAHFTVLTSSSPRVAEQWARQLERFRVALGQMMPASAERLQPVVVVVFPDEAAFRPYRMLEHGQPAAVAGYFARTNDANVIGLAVEHRDVRTRRIVFHEGTHWFLNARDGTLPPWLEEGIAEVFSTLTSDDKNFTIGAPLEEHLKLLRRDGLLPLRYVITLPRDRIEYNELERTGRYYAESWLFAHWMMFGSDSPGWKGLARYLELLRAGGDRDAAFNEAFGGDYQAVGRRLAAYLKNGQYRQSTYPLPILELGSVERARPAKAGEVEYALGALAMGGQGPAPALPHLRHAAQLAPGEVRTWELLGTTEMAAGNHGAALADLERAIQLGSRSALVWNNRAVLRQEAAHGTTDFFVTTDRTEFERDASDFRRALEFDPRCRPAYQSLAGVVYGVEPFQAGDLRRLEHGHELYPEDDVIAVGCAAARLHTAEAAAGETALRAALVQGSLSSAARRLAESALEGEKIKAINAHLARLGPQHRYAEMAREIDELLRDPTINDVNRQSLRGLRREVDEMRRIDEGVETFNRGQPADALAIFRAVLAESPTNVSVKQEAARLLKECEKALATPH